MNYFSIIAMALLLCACNQEKTLDAQAIVDNAITKAGGANYEHAKITFNFRNKVYKSTRQCKRFELERLAIDSSGTITHDKVSNDGLLRLKNDQPQALADSLVTRISDGVNSVHYFAQLPYGLNDEAVNKQLVGEALVKTQPYYKIKVTFQQEGGGTDFQDVFMYWIHKTEFTVDYLAYSYEVNGGGVRFREAYNPRVIEGIRFVDYNNYKPSSKDVPLERLDALFEEGALQLLSKIETKEVAVEILNVDC